MMNIRKKQRYTPVTNENHPCGNITYHSFRGTTIYILHGKNGDMLIDTGLFHIKRALKKWADRYDIKYIFITHAHADHDWNAKAFKKRFGAKLILNKKDLALRRDFIPMFPTRRKYRFKCSYLNITGRLFHSPFYKPDIVIDHGGTDFPEKLGFDAKLVFLPGHTKGMTGILSGDTLYCGDAFTALFYEPEIPPYAMDIEVMKKTLKRIASLDIKWLACGHGLPVKMSDARKVIADYLRKG